VHLLEPMHPANPPTPIAWASRRGTASS